MAGMIPPFPSRGEVGHMAERSKPKDAERVAVPEDSLDAARRWAIAVVAAGGHMSGEVEGCTDPYGERSDGWCDACWAEAAEMLAPDSQWEVAKIARRKLERRP